MSLTIFKFQKLEVRTVMIKNEPWFVAKDVCEALSIANTSDAVERLEEDEKGVATTDSLSFRIGSNDMKGTGSVSTLSLPVGSTDTNGPLREVLIVNEAGLYRLIFTSRKEEAEKFKRWVFHDVLPTIRKTGEYNHERYLTETLPYALSDIEDKMYRLESELREMNIQLNKAKRALLPKPSPKKTKAELKFQALKDAALCELHTSGVSMTLKELSSKIGVPTYELAQVLNTTQEVKQDRDKNPFNPTLSM